MASENKKKVGKDKPDQKDDMVNIWLADLNQSQAEKAKKDKK